MLPSEVHTVHTVHTFSTEKNTRKKGVVLVAPAGGRESTRVEPEDLVRKQVCTGVNV